MSSLEGKVAIVTGAASGIGRATARLLAEKGARVVVADVNEAGGRETVDQIKLAEGQGLFVKTDVTSAVEVQSLVDKTLTAFGGVHVLHNNAGVYRVHDTIDEVSEEEWRFMIDVDLNSLFVLARAVYPIMRSQGGGAVINTASTAAFGRSAGFGRSGRALAYTAAKHGVLGLTRALASLGEQDDIRVNCICPAGVNTPLLTDVNPDVREEELLKPEDIARAVLYLATDDSITGAAVSIHLRDGQAQYFKAKEMEWESIEGV